MATIEEKQVQGELELNNLECVNDLYATDGVYLIPNIFMFKEKLVETLPTENIKANTIYITKDDNDQYESFVRINGEWIPIGSQTCVDETNGLTKYEGCVGIKFKEMTMEQWNALTPQEQQESGFVKITDGEATAEALIDDTDTSFVKTWSSKKLSQNMTTVDETKGLEKDEETKMVGIKWHEYTAEEWSQLTEEEQLKSGFVKITDGEYSYPTLYLHAVEFTLVGVAGNEFGHCHINVWKSGQTPFTPTTFVQWIQGKGHLSCTGKGKTSGTTYNIAITAISQTTTTVNNPIVCYSNPDEFYTRFISELTDTVSEL